MFLLLLMGLGAASVKAQVRIGGNTPPNAAAALDLNADDSATPAGNKGALALPRVNLASTTAQLNGVTPITGMLVYNTSGTLAAGAYYWDGSKWVALLIPVSSAYNSTITWHKTLDSTVTVPALAIAAVAVVPAATQFSDVCRSNRGYFVTAYDGQIIVTPPTNAPAYVTRFVCFRPSF